MNSRTPARPLAPMLAAVGAVAFALRLLHTQSLLADPLFYVPLGGNAPYLEMAERIAAGRWVPDGAFTINSPLYPYVLAGIYKLFGVGSFYAVRLMGAAGDAGTAVLVALLAARHFGAVAGWAAGLLFAAYGPAIFFAGELAPVPYTLLLLTAAIVLLDGRAAWLPFAGAGLLLGVATGTRPNLLLAGFLALAVPWTRGAAKPRRLAGAVAAGLVLGLAPVTLLNYAATGEVTLLTLSGGHNLYIGHNPSAQPQYSLPAALDGDIFETMKDLAEELEGPLEPGEVSGFYLRRTLDQVARNPGREASLTARRALLLVNDFEATTYANPDYQRHYSPVLRWMPGFAWLLALAVPGMILVWDRRRFHLWIPVLTAAVSVLAFFYIARLRVVMVPALAVFAGGALARVTALWREDARRGVAVAAVLAVLAFTVAKIPLLTSDPSNDWNKAGGVLVAMERYDEALEAFRRAESANPANPNTYANLVLLYTRLGRPDEATAAGARLDALTAGEASERQDFLDGLRDRR